MDKKTIGIIDNLIKKHGRSWRKYYRVRKNYPFGKKSKPVYTIERK